MSTPFLWILYHPCFKLLSHIDIDFSLHDVDRSSLTSILMEFPSSHGSEECEYLTVFLLQIHKIISIDHIRQTRAHSHIRINIHMCTI